MKHSYILGLIIFALGVAIIAVLSSPKEATWIAMYLDNQKLKRAETLLTKKFQRDPSDLETAAKLVDTLDALHEYGAARQIVMEVLGKNPDNLEWKRRLAMIYLGEDNPALAAQVLPPQ